jgi:hypothetical protein
VPRLEFLGLPHQDFHLCHQPRGFGQDGFVLLLQSFDQVGRLQYVLTFGSHALEVCHVVGE